LLQELTTIKNVLSGILDYRGEDALNQAIGDITRQIKGASPYWVLRIHPDLPLRFVECEVERLKFQVDLFCTIPQPDRNVPGLNESIGIRVWSNDSRLFFRKELDSESILERMNSDGRRVMLRFHFDRAEQGKKWPEHHFQVGGDPQENEHCWHPKQLNVPRLIHHPLNLLLACELVVANFFPENYHLISREPTWKGALKKAQEHFIEPYIKKIRIWNSEVSLLQHLWSHEEAN